MFNVHCDVNAEVDRNVHGLICAVGIVLCDVQCNIQCDAHCNVLCNVHCNVLVVM